MIETIMAWALLVTGLVGNNELLVVASGIYAVAANLNNIYHKKG